MTRTSPRWSALGWHGLSFQTPDGWNIGTVSGDANAGYLRLDDLEMPRVEVRWEPAKGREPIGQVVDRYLGSLTKRSRKQATPVKIRRNLSLRKDTDDEPARAVECFHWRSEGNDPLQAYGLLWRCSTCSRIVFIQVMAHVGESILPTATRLLNSLQDHPVGETATWAMYGLHVKVPIAYILKEHRFLTGRILLRFAGDGADLDIERLSIADMLLRGRTFEEWFQETTDGDIARQTALPSEAFRHPGWMATGSMADPTARRRLRWLPRRWRVRHRAFDRCAWHCPDSNKLYTIRRLSDSADSATVLEIARSVVCH